MSEVRVLILALVTAAGVWLGGVLTYPGISRHEIILVLMAVTVTLVRGRSWLLLLMVAVLALALGMRAGGEYQRLEASSYEGLARLLTDPKPTAHGWRAEAKLDSGKRVLLTGAGFAADPLGRAGAGEVLRVEGRIKPAPDSGWFRSRHLVGRLTMSEVEVVEGVPWFQMPSELLRSTVSRGAGVLGERHRNLYLGLVIGDDRFQPASQRAQFRAAGLSHLLAVSGQNVAFVLAVVAPFVRRLGLGGRVVVIGLVLLIFAVATRMEPSVLRATVSAGIATSSVALGRQSTGLRTLCLATTGLLLIDPLLINSVGFGLSVSASLGILLLGPSLRQRMKGPPTLVEPLSVTVAAQFGVSPILMAVFGPVSLVSLPANVLAGWAAGGVMMWGLTVGILAGIAPGWLAAPMQFPAKGMVWWIDSVAAWAGRVGAPDLGLSQTMLGAAMLLGLWWLRGDSLSFIHPLLAHVLRGVTVLALAALWISAAPAPPGAQTVLRGGGTWWPGSAREPSILVVAGNADNRLVDAMVNDRILSIDLVVLERGHRGVGQLLGEIGDVADLGQVLAPADHRVIGARRLLSPLWIPLEDGRMLMITPDEKGLEVTVLDA